MLKTIISILTSVQLMFLQVVVPLTVTQSLFSATAAHAQEGGVVDKIESNGITSVGAGQEGEMTKIFEGLQPDKAGDMLNFIMMIIIGFLAAGLMKCEKKSADIYIAAVGGLIYIAGEIMQYFKADSKFKEEAIEYETSETGAPKLDENQLEAFAKQKEGYTAARDAAKQKAMMQKAAAAAFGVAGATALVSSFMFKSAEETCKLEGESIAATSIAGNPAGPACMAAVAKVAEWQGLSETAKPSEIDFANCQATAVVAQACPGASCQALTGFAGNACASCANFMVPDPVSSLPFEQQYKVRLENYQHYANAQQCKMPQEQLITSNLYYNIVEKALDLFFPAAQAKMNPLVTLFGGLGAGIAVVMLLKESIKPVLGFMLGTPMKRGIVYTMMAGVSFMVSKKSEEVAKVMQENIDKIDAIVNRFNNLEGTQQRIDNAFGNQPTLTNVPIRVGQPIGTDGEPFPCLSTTSKDNKCIDNKKIIESSLGQSNLELPPGVSSLASTVGETGNGITGRSSLSSGAVEGASSLASNARKIDGLNRSLEKQLNDLNRKAGKNPFNFNKARNDLLGKLQGSMLKALDKKGLNGYQALAAVAPASAPAIASTDGINDELKKAVAKQDATPTSSGNKAASNGGFQFKFDEPKTDALNFGNAKPQGLAGIDEGELDVDDIVDDENVSIFKVISVRYIKSGYPRVLKLKEDPKNATEKE